jgi:phosphatidylglycerophosphatase A
MARFLASWFGTGLILGKLRDTDLGSGTVAAAATFPLALWIGNTWGWLAQIGAAVVIFFLGVLVTSRFTKKEGDAGWMVIDEAAGTFVAMIGLTLGPALAAWAVFRVADIYKNPFPGVAQAERLHGPWGVMTDDLVAGLYGLIAGHIVQFLV